MEELRLNVGGGEGMIAPASADAASVEFLFRTHYRSLVQSLALICGCDKEAAADAVGDAFLELEENWDRVSTYENPAAWIRRVALNRLLNQRRSFVRRARALFHLQSQARETSGGARVTDLALKDQLSRLPLKQRTAVVLFYFADLPVTDVAAAMGITEGSVNRHLHRAREALRMKLEVDHDQ